VFQAWNPAEKLNPGGGAVGVYPVRGEAEELAMEARHDLVFAQLSHFGLRPAGQFGGLATVFTPESIRQALSRRRALLALNPHMIMLAEVRFYDAPASFLPPDSPWWKRGPDGERIQDRFDRRMFLLDFAEPSRQAVVAQQCRAAVATGVVDGCMLDWFRKEDPDRLALIRRVRTAVGDGALLIVNANDSRPERSAPYINGIYMEGLGAPFFRDWRTAAANLLWAQTHLRAPVITALDGWYPLEDPAEGADVSDIQRRGRGDLALMREVTTLSLTHSNGYVLYGDPNPLPTPDHLHDWYRFWNKGLGRPISPMGRPVPGGAFRRDFEHGTVIFNPPSNRPVHVAFAQERLSEATGRRGRDHDVAAGDGDIFLTLD
jgi:hypothetical protein